MARLERVYNVPLRKEWLKVPKYQRAAKAMRALKAFVARHMKSDKVLIGQFANLEIWSHGIKSPPHHLKVNAVKEEDGTVIAELFGKPIPERKKEKPVEKGAVKKAVEALTGLKVKEKKPEEKSREEAKPVEAKSAALSPAPTEAPAPSAPPAPSEAQSPKDAPGKAPVKKERKAKVVRK